MNTFSHYLSALLFISSILPSPAALSLPPLFLSPQDATTIVEIQNLINLFAVAVDQHRWDLLAQVFEPDVTADFNVPDAPVAHGLDAVIQLLRRLEGYPSYHSQGSHYVDLSNPQRPHAVTYVTGTFFLPNRLHTSYGRCVKSGLLIPRLRDENAKGGVDLGTKMIWSERRKGGGLLVGLL
ncbi:MAG: hypothetical protein HETSPECPRED_001976 [Heterodermia speciosa]|uniref:SnoaL-like domain-containing protein n=1 Tax=Heterodermia speciosa TaxID=116794 RepID=A0A8H3IFZ9_9LECA|nr:MAG: hypothetical protein HETSPECPRED_001976 [Heterodermia speciosa]